MNIHLAEVIVIGGFILALNLTVFGLYGVISLMIKTLKPKQKCKSVDI